MPTVTLEASRVNSNDGWTLQGNYGGIFEVTHNQKRKLWLRVGGFNGAEKIPSDAIINSVTLKVYAYISNTNGYFNFIVDNAQGQGVYSYTRDTRSSYSWGWIRNIDISNNLGGARTDAIRDFIRSDFQFAINGGTYSTSALISAATVRVRYVQFVVDYSLPTYYLDINGRLDGADTGSLNPFGTCDVYINNSKVGSAVEDWYTQYESGASYRIDNIVAKPGYKYVGVVEGSLSGTITGTTNIRLAFTTQTYTIRFDSRGGTSVDSKIVNIGDPYGNLPTPTKAGYTFVGWYPNQMVFDSGYFNGSRFEIIPRSYMYTDKIAVHIEAYMKNWKDIETNGKQLISSTESGGWGIGYAADTGGHGAEININGVGYKGIDFNISSLSSGWHSFDMIFDGSRFIGYIDGVQKGNISTGGTSIKYNSSNAIFIGAEAGGNATTPADHYFIGNIANVQIVHDGTLLTPITSSTNLISDSNHTLYAAWRINNYTISVTQSGSGTVSGGGEFAYGTSATISATPSTGYRFSRWSDGNTNATRTVTVTADKTYTAVFEKLSYTISASSNPANGGTISNTGTYEYGSIIQLKAIPSTNYKFLRWNDGDTSTSKIITVTENKSYIAYFEYVPPEYTIITVASPESGGRIIGGGTFAENTTITLQAIPNANYNFVGWSDKDTNPEKVITVTQNDTYIAYFELKPIDKVKEIYVGGTRISDLYSGDKPITEVYIGNTLVYQF